MRPDAFLRAYAIPSIAVALATILGCIAVLGNFATLSTVSPKLLEAGALVLFALGIVAFFYQMNNRLLSVYAAAGAGVEGGTIRLISLDGRRYVPASFGKAYLDFERTSYNDLMLDEFMAAHVGQWITLSGYFRSLSGFSDIHVSVAPDEDMSSIFYANFDKSWGPYLAKLKRGDPIEFDAKITKRQPFGCLWKAELR